MFEPCFNTSGGISSPQNNVQQIPPILFRKRTEKIDWRRLASIDVNRIASHVDIESLQEMLTSVTFCDITSEIDTRYIDTNFIKLFQLAQLLIEYLLYSQDYLTTSLDSLKEQNQELNKKCEKLKQQLQEKTNRLTLTRRECHRRRLLLMAQQELMDSGPQSLHKCMYCPKAFVNASFLATHIHRRHPETEMPHVNVPYSTAHMTGTVTDDMPYPHTQHLPCCGAMHPSKMSPRQMPQQTECHYTTNNNMSASLERDVRALLEQLKSVTPSLPNRSNSPVKSIGFDVDIATKGTNESDWHTQLLEEHRRDIEAMKRGFEKELHALQIQYNQTQEELYKLKCRPATSNLGELENDVSGTIEVVNNQFNNLTTKPSLQNPHMNQYVTDINATNIQRCQQFHPTELPVKYSSSVQRHSTSIYASCPLTGSCTDLGMIEKGAESQHNKTYTVNTSCTESVCSVKFTKPQYHTDMKDNYNDVDDDDDDKAERDITESIDENIQNCQKSTKIASNLLGKRKEKIDTNEIPNKKLSPSKFTSVKLNSLLKHKHKHFRSTAIQVGAGKYNRLTSGQVKNNKNTYVNFERDYNSSPIVLKVKRAHSLQSLSSEPTSINVFKKGVSFSTNKKAFIQHGGNLAQEVVIVRTEDQSRSLMNSSERSNDTHSIHLIPAVILNKDGTSSNNEPSLNTLDLADEFEQPVFRPSRAASASGSIRRSGYNRNYDEQVEIGSHHSLQIDDKESTVHGSTVSGSTTRFVRRRSPQQAFRDTINNEGKEESEAQQVSRAMGRVLTASGGTSPTPSLNASTNMLRYSRLLDQLRSDPETLRKLRHEVEQLLIEQLNERGIKQDQNRLSTSQLNQKLNVLNKEREHLAKKHPNFMEIRDALAQHVDRLAHATIRGSTGNIIELRQRGENNQKMNFSYKAGLPPPAAYSPASLRRAGTLPLASQRVDVTSNLGVSLPILSVNNDMGSSQSNMTEGMNSLNKRPTGYFESKPRLQRSSPQLQYITEETKSESSASKQQPPSIHQQAHTTSQKYSPSHMNNNNNNNTSNNNNNNNSSINNSSSNGQQKHGTSNSPEIHFSHDQKVVTFGGQSSETNRNLAVVQSSEDDEWDSETEDLNAVAAEINKAQQLNLSNSTQKLVNPRNLEVSFYKPSNSNTTTNNNIKQGNNNASIPPNPQGIKYSLYKGQSLKTDDEDIFSVSSINGGLAEDNSLSLAPEVSPRHTKRPVGVSRSLDPSVAAAHAEASALGPRPTTRVGGINRQPITAKHTSIGSPELSNTMATSLWGTNSKAASPSTNVISVARSDGAYDEFDSDD